MNEANRTPVTGKSPSDAYPVGSMIKSPIIPGYGPGPKIGDLQISLLEVVRGKELAERVESGQIPPVPQKNGFDNIAVNLKVEYARYGRGPREQPYRLTDGQFLACSQNGSTEYKVIPLVEESQGGLIGHVYKAGEARQGWLYCQVPAQETSPYLLYRRENVDNVWGLWSDIWFKLF